MVEELIIKNYALIDNLRIEFKKGFNVLTGESGSGKSLVAGALAQLKGSRNNADIIRKGRETAEISGIFNVAENSDALSWLELKGIESDDGSVIIRKVLKKSGRSTVQIQSVPVTRNDLIEFTSFIFDIHGQHEHHTVMDSSRQRSLLDSNASLSEDVEKLKNNYNELGRIRKELTALESSEQERLREIDILKFSINEIKDASIVPGEDEDLENEHRLLVQHEKLYSSVEETYQKLSESSEGALSLLRASLGSSQSASEIDPELKGVSSRLGEAFYEIEDISETFRDYLLKDSYSPERLSECEERLSVIHKLKKKYGPTAADVLDYLKKSEERLERIENYEEDRDSLIKKASLLEKEVLKDAETISSARKVNALVLGERIEGILKNLGMKDAVFKIEVNVKKNSSGQPVCGPYGMDEVEFLISPNRGENPKPVEDIASGGEISRIMLAVKSVLSEKDHVNSMLFDEIDTGIGGEVAVSLGEHLLLLSEKKQIICITHLASIAANADNHLKAEKNVVDGRTISNVVNINSGERVSEIARMLSGNVSGSISVEHAKELLGKRV